MDKKQNFRRGIADALDIPSEITMGEPRIVITGMNQLLLENHRGILHFSAAEIQVAFRGGTMKIKGENLVLPILKRDILEVEGTILSVNFII